MILCIDPKVDYASSTCWEEIHARILIGRADNVLRPAPGREVQASSC